MTPEREAQMREMFVQWMKTREGYPFAGAFANLMWDSWLACARALEPLVRDGERYRFLRDVEHPLCIYRWDGSVDVGSTGVADIGETICAADADRVIDAAMSAALEDGNATE